MHPILLLFLIGCFLCGCVPGLYNLDQAKSSQKLLGSITDNRYSPEDGGFSVFAPRASSPYTKIIERQEGDCRSITFECTLGGPTLRYDVTFFEDKELFFSVAFDVERQKYFLEGFFHEFIFPTFYKQCNDIKIAYEERVSKDGEIYYLALLQVPISLPINLDTKKPLQDHIGVLLTIKGRNLFTIQLQNGILFSGDLERAKEKLIPSLINFSQECTVKDEL